MLRDPTLWVGGSRSPGHGIICALLSCLIAGMAIGMMLPLLPLRLEAMGESPASIGFHAIASSFPILMLAPFMGPGLTRLGAPKLLIASAFLMAVPFTIMPFIIDYWVWFALRLVVGIGAAIGWVATEAWINQAAPDHLRGRILSLYVITFMGGIALGSPILAVIGVTGALPLLVLSGLCVATILPVLFGWNAAPAFPEGGEKGLFRLLFIAPVLMVCGFIMGLADGSVFSLAPIFGTGSGMDQSAAIACLTSFVVGGVALQYPLGWMSDKVNRRWLIAGLATASIPIALAIPISAPAEVTTWMLFGLLGICVIGLYSISLGVVGARFRGAEMGAANAFFIMAFEFGAMSGAPFSGLAMELAGPQGLMWVVATASGFVVLAAIVRGAAWLPHTENSLGQEEGDLSLSADITPKPASPSVASGS